MSTDEAQPHRRRRRRATAAQGPPAPPPVAAPAEPPVAAPAAPAQKAQTARTARTTARRTAARTDKPRKRRAPREAGAERGLGDLVGATPSQLGVDGALRARDVNRPTAEDLAAAERTTVVVRRNWQPDASGQGQGQRRT